MNLLVLGAGSQLGKAFTALLKRQGIDHSTLASNEINLLKQMEVVKTVTRLSPTQVVNVAEYCTLEEAESDPEAARQCDIVNSQGMSVLAEVCNHLNLPLIHHSSSYVFDGTKKSAYTEEDQTNPVCRYGMSKWYAERTIRETLHQHVIVRTDSLFSDRETGFFKTHIDACKRQHGQIQVINHRSSPTYIDDAARVLLAIAWQLDCAAVVWGTYHYCALQAVSQAQFVEYILREAAAYDADLAREIPSLDIEILPTAQPYIANSVLNCQKIMETFGIKQRSRAGGVTAVLDQIYRPSKARKKQTAKPPAQSGAPSKRIRPGKKSTRKKPPASARPAKKAAVKKTSPSP